MILQQEPQRLAALLREHGQLLAKIKQKKGERERLEERIRETIRSAQTRALPLVDELLGLDRQIHALFTELLGRKKQPRKAQKIVRAVYSSLQETGEISPAGIEGAEEELPDFAATAAAGGPEGAPGSAADGEMPPWATGGVTARRPSQTGAASSLRSLFHRLAEALHPDKVQDEQEKAERTDAMKELTQAYQAGDLAQLLELERTWLLSLDKRPAAAERTEEAELTRRCAQLEKTNQALRLQLTEVNRELRELRRSPPAAFVSELRRMAAGSGKDPVDAWLEGLQEQREGLVEILDFVRLYHEGRIDLQTFERGPRTARWDDEPEPDELDLLQELIAGLAELAQARSRRPRGSRGPRKPGPPRDATDGRT